MMPGLKIFLFLLLFLFLHANVCTDAFGTVSCSEKDFPMALLSLIKDSVLHRGAIPMNFLLYRTETESACCMLRNMLVSGPKMNQTFINRFKMTSDVKVMPCTVHFTRRLHYYF